MKNYISSHQLSIFPTGPLGFTLIELQVVTSIIIFLSVIVLFNYRAGESQLALQRSAHKLAQDIRRAQEMAMSVKEYDGEIPSRYGIECTTTNPNYCILFADKGNNGLYEEDQDKEVEKITFEKGVSVQQLLIVDPSSPPSRTRIGITFKPPDPTTTIRSPGDPDDGFSVTQIVLTNGNKIKTITVNKVGLIYVE
ncbi:MAG: type II secretion system protein [Patescibacteria group bacterium]|nr:type II secretion system protein [Patescibacteria group bacterium]